MHTFAIVTPRLLAVRKDESVEGTTSSSSRPPATSALRRGKWFYEEEAYALQVIHEFHRGVLDIPEGTTLRNLLADLLCCDPMRLSKKFVREHSIRKQEFRRNLDICSDLSEIFRSAERLQELERLFDEKIAQQTEIAVRASLDSEDNGAVGAEDDLLSELAAPARRSPLHFVAAQSSFPQRPAMLDSHGGHGAETGPSAKSAVFSHRTTNLLIFPSAPRSTTNSNT